ncbi:hypothetical protein MA16_Dca028407 [Dendrobium catenatum]|uniref:Uncharacterized protein n=1 Tax=Dendrobium catenatum TaxID=906689 RepID=A0A2I0VD52_9ASPA|nr:hypothetical protein MA16_Dca028407 [Dendrobium catenatum]
MGNTKQLANMGRIGPSPIRKNNSKLITHLATKEQGSKFNIRGKLIERNYVVHVVETNGGSAPSHEPSSYISLFSLTPGSLVEESERLKDEGFDCGRKNSLDFVSFTVKYGCLSFKDTDAGWSKSEIPSLDVESDSSVDSRITRVLVDTKHSKRWSLAINTELISDFSFEGNIIHLLNS